MFRTTAFAVMTICLAAGCSGDDDTVADPTSFEAPTSSTAEPTSTSAPIDDPTSTAAPSTPATPDPTATVEPTVEPTIETAPIELVLADRVRELFAIREAANDAPAPDPDDPAMATVATGEALQALVDETARRLDDGLAIRAGEAGLADIRVGFIEAAATTASVSVCSVDDGVIYRVDTGEVLNDAVATHNYQVDLELVDGVWLTNRVVRLQQWEGVAGCALAPGDFPY